VYTYLKPRICLTKSNTSSPRWYCALPVCHFVVCYLLLSFTNCFLLIFASLYFCCVSSVVHAMSLESAPAAIAALHGIAAAGADEPICSADCSGYSLANAMQSAAQGAFYPAGGASAIAAALARTITQAGGVVYCGAEVREIVLEEVPGTKAVKTTGITVAVPSVGSRDVQAAPTSTIDALEAKSDENNANTVDITFHAEKSVISGLGVIATFAKVFPTEAISPASRQMLAGLREVRPVVKVVYWLRGDAPALGLSSTDYYEVGTQPRLRRAKSPDSPTADTAVSNASAGTGAETPTSAADEEDASRMREENDRARDKFAGEYAHVWSPSCKDPTWAAR
jgi:hypothetical protein